jgi:glycosyltransferase involved in cell wall biosynthesis
MNSSESNLSVPVSVILPVYNCERFLAESIESVLSQAYQPLELIVVDDGSTDGSGVIAQRYDKVQYIWQENAGVSAARNRGLEFASGEFIAHQDADDIWLPKKLELQVRCLLDHPEVGYTVGRTKFFLEDGCTIPDGFRAELLQNDHAGRYLQATLMRKSVVEGVGLFDTGMKVAEDIDWFSRANDLNISLITLREIVVHKRVHDMNITYQQQFNNQHLLKALRRSVERKRNAQ